MSDETAAALQATHPDRVTFPYDGFISYRHSPKQTLIVSAIEEALHRFAKPFWKLRALRVCTVTRAISQPAPTCGARSSKRSTALRLFSSQI